MSTTPLVDHIVILIPHSFLSAPPTWFADLFHFYPGGRHADGLTENTLALLADGSYLEFIAFVPGVDPARRAAHHWGGKQEGDVVDWALTLPSSEGGGKEDAKLELLGQQKAFEQIQRKVRDKHLGVEYADLVGGGRVRPDGEVLKWEVAFPKRADDVDGGPVERGSVPFWCLDVTPRQLRVPYEVAPEFTKHPTGAVGVAGIEVLLEPGKTTESAGGVYDVLFGDSAKAGDNAEWKISSLAGQGIHSSGAVRLGPADGTKELHINISFFTDDKSLVGKSVGGKVDEQHTLTFNLVAASNGSG
ncbi:glyoxalase-like domain-containing protein [Hypoxylon rubiginosum]|uniref:Glyoxalase-like domain-containing protein n=1 Tax=Hypoxylon rubiginosum TaxID=110542 RepID=A0ACC0CRW3_9PEZI|nr:glyoxalase-like domain-containing protein [Hypoxylon rubiginosum]